MSPRIRVYWFSGTGNTKAVAELLAEAFTRRGRAVVATPIEEVVTRGAPLDLDSGDLLGIGYPIHAFNAPRIVFEFVRRLPAASAQRAFTFKCPGDPLCQGGSTSMVRGALARRGYRVFHESMFVGPANVAIRFDDRLVRQLYLAARRKAELRAEEILGGVERLQRNGLWLRVGSWLFSMGETYGGAPWFGRCLRAGRSCTLCGRCVRECPTGNITLRGDRIRFGARCVFCMRCCYGCPSDAIAPRMLPFVKIKQWSDFAAIGSNADCPADYLTERTRGYFRHYRSYLEEA